MRSQVAPVFPQSLLKTLSTKIVHGIRSRLVLSCFARPITAINHIMNEPQNRNSPTGAAKLFTLLTLALFCAVIAFMVFRYSPPRAEPPRRLWWPVVVATNGSETVLADSRQFEFWTPSVKTKDFLEMEGGHVVDPERWEVLQNENALLEFGTLLHSNKNVLGYRRVEVLGQGRTPFKPGWWWTVNVLNDYSAGEMGRIYQNFWKSSQAVFIEVIDNHGHLEE